MQSFVFGDLGFNDLDSVVCSDAVLIPSLIFKFIGLVSRGHAISTGPDVRGQKMSCFLPVCPQLCVSVCATKWLLSDFFFLFSVLALLFLSFSFSVTFYHSITLCLCLTLCLHCTLSVSKFFAHPLYLYLRVFEWRHSHFYWL